MTQRSYVWMVLLVLLATGTASWARDRTPQCVLASDCAGELLCLGGYCRAACLSDRDCPSDARCVYHPPGQTARPIAELAAESSSGSYLRCELADGSRVPPRIGAIPFWRSDEERRRTPPQCARNSECTGSSVCSPRGQCVTQCREDRDCGSGLLCVNDAPGTAGPVRARRNCVQNEVFNLCASPSAQNQIEPRCPRVPVAETAGPASVTPAGTAGTPPPPPHFQCALNSDCAGNLRCNAEVGLCSQACRTARDCLRGEICSYREPGREAVVNVDTGSAIPNSRPEHFLCELPAPPARAASGSAGFTGLETTINVGTGVSTHMDGADLPGSDYHRFATGGGEVRPCMEACVNDARCQAWTWVRDGSVCWLKHSRQMLPRSDSCCVSGRKVRGARPDVETAATREIREPLFSPPPILAPPSVAAPAGMTNALPPAPATAGTFEADTNRAGSDFLSLALAQPDPKACQAACKNDGRCQAWTYVKPGIQGKEARCWLKAPAPPARPDACCVSGVR